MALKRCPKCGETKSLDEFPRNKSKQDGHQAYCRPCWGDINRAAYEKDPEMFQMASRRWKVEHAETYNSARRTSRRRLREEILSLLGDCCSSCGTTDDLQIDHVHEDGAAHRAQFRPRGTDERVYLDALESIKRGEGRFQLLCGPHNREKHQLAKAV